MIKILITFVLSLQLHALDLPSAGSYASLSEKKSGHEFLQILWDSNSIISDVESQLYLQDIGQEMVAHSQSNDKHFDFFLLDKSSVNAFAGPYGYIGIHSGMLLESESEAELAGVLAHEIAHVSQNHLQRFDDKTDKQSYLMAAGMLAAALVNSSEASQAIAASTVAGAAQQSINFTREHEWEADRVGTRILQKSGYNPQGLADFFSKLKNSENAKEFLQTHPLSVNRMADTVQRVARDHGEYRADSFTYLTLRARLYYHEYKRIEHTTNMALQKYMQAYADFDNQRYRSAKAHIMQSLEMRHSASGVILASRILSKLGEVESAKTHLQALNPGEVAYYYLAKLYYENEMPRQGIQVLKAFLRTHQGSYQTNRLMSDLYVATGTFERSHIYSARALVVQGELEAAIDQYQRAKTLTNSQDLFDVLTVKIEQLQQKLDLYESLD